MNIFNHSDNNQTNSCRLLPHAVHFIMSDTFRFSHLTLQDQRLFQYFLQQ